MFGSRDSADETAQFTRPGEGEFDRVAAHYDYLMRNVPYGKWVDYLEALMQRHAIRPRIIVDLCCGTGKVGSELIRRGYVAVGVDLSEPMARRCASQEPPLPAAVMDARRLGLRAGSIDLVVSLYDSLNYILEPEGLQECFRRVADALSPGGWFIFDMNTTLALAARYFAHSNRGSGDKLEYTWTPTWNPQTRICRIDMEFEWRGEGGPEHYREVHFQRAYEIRELRAFLTAAGFKELHFYHAYTFRRPHRWTDRIYVAAGRGEGG